MDTICSNLQNNSTLLCLASGCILFVSLYLIDADIILCQDSVPPRTNQSETPTTSTTILTPSECSAESLQSQETTSFPTKALEQPPQAAEFTIKDTGINMDLWLVMREQEIYLDLEENIDRLVEGRLNEEMEYQRALGWEDALKEIGSRLSTERRRKLREVMGAIREGIVNDS